VVGSGSVNVDPSESSYATGASVTLTAEADEGYVLDYWEVDGLNAGSDEVLVITINDNREVIAHFLLT
jgi:hypothetical protein